MNRFALARPRSFEQAGKLLKDSRFSLPVIKAGGMDIVDHLKEGLIEPDLLIDVRHLDAHPGQPRIDVSPDGQRPTRISIGATTTLAEIAASEAIRTHAPVVAQAVASAATPQVRNVATAAGNLLQRPRCWYYRNEQFDCLKKGGHTCYAVEGENQYHAVFGGGPCHIVHPSNLAPALHVCDATVHLTGGQRESIALGDLYHLPGHGVRDEHNLEAGEVVTEITITPQRRSGFYAVKAKQSFDWPLVFVAVALELDADTITSARICAGAVAPVPWPLPKVEEALRGVRIDDDAALRDACAAASGAATPLSDNAYKLKLLPVAVRRAVLKAAGRGEEDDA